MYTPLWNSKTSKGVPSLSQQIPAISLDFAKRDFLKNNKKIKKRCSDGEVYD